MPSYNLIKSQNLGDVDDSLECLGNLGIGTAATHDMHAVDFHCRAIAIDELRLSSTDTVGKILSVQKVGEEFELVWSHVTENAWFLQDTVNVSLFENDVEFVTHEEMAFKGSFYELSGFPDVTDVFLSANTFIVPSSNLLDLFSMDEARENLKLGYVSTCDDYDLQLEDITVEGVLRIRAPGTTPLFFSSYRAGNLQEWNDPVVSNRVEDEVAKLRESTQVDSNVGVSSRALYDWYSNLDIDIARNAAPLIDAYKDVENRINEGYFIGSNLDSVDIDANKAQGNLDIGTLARQNAEELSVVNLTAERIVLSNLRDMDGVLCYDGKHESSNDISPTSFDYASSTALGVVSILQEVQDPVNAHSTDPRIPIVYNLSTTFDLFKSVESNLSDFQTNLATETVIDSTVLNEDLREIIFDVDMNGITDDERSNFFDALEIDSHFINNPTLAGLKNVPVSIKEMYNDGYMDCVVTVENPEEARNNLFCSNMALQHNDDVDIRNGDAVLSKLEVDGTFALRATGNHSETAIAANRVFFATHGDGEVKLLDIQDPTLECNRFQHGFVKVIQSGEAMIHLLDPDTLTIDFPKHALSPKLAKIAFDYMGGLLSKIEAKLGI